MTWGVRLWRGYWEEGRGQWKSLCGTRPVTRHRGFTEEVTLKQNLERGAEFFGWHGAGIKKAVTGKGRTLPGSALRAEPCCGAFHRLGWQRDAPFS